MCQAGIDLLCLQEILEDAIYTGRLIGRQKLVVPSGAFHAEAYLGDRVAMEDFAVRMREAEVSRAEHEAQAVLIRAAKDECGQTQNAIRKILVNTSRHEVQIATQNPICGGKWQIRFRNESLGTWDADSNPGRTVTIKVVSGEAAKSKSDLDRFAWVLFNTDTRQCFTSDENTSFAVDGA